MADDDAQAIRTELRPPHPWETDPTTTLPEDAFQPWERWAWSRIATGETADMGLFPSHGGAYWDAVPEDVRKATPFPVLDSWRAHDETAPPSTEADATDDLARARDRLGKLLGDEPPEQPPAARWPAWQTLSARFLRTVLFVKPWSKARSRAFVRIARARVLEGLDFENEVFDGELSFYTCRFEQELNLRGLTITKLLNVHGSTFVGPINADRIDVGGGVFMRGGACFKSEVRFVIASIGANFEAESSVFEAPFGASGARVTASLFLHGARFQQAVTLTGIDIGDQFAVDRSIFAGGLMGDTLEAGGDVFLRNGAKFLGPVKLLGCRLSQDVQLCNSTFADEVDLSGSHVAGEIVLDSPAHLPPRWSSDPAHKPQLILRNVTAGALQCSIGGWLKRDAEGNPMRGGRRAAVARDLGGFSFGRLGGLGAGLGSTLADASGAELVDWLEHGQTRKRFTPAPYRALAKALDDAGDRAKARVVLRALGRHEADCAPLWPPHRKLAFWLSGLLIGYGFGLWRAGWWFTMVIAAFAVLGVAWEAGASPIASAPGLGLLGGALVLLLAGASLLEERGVLSKLSWLLFLGAIAGVVAGGWLSGALQAAMSASFADWRAWLGYSFSNATPIVDVVPRTDVFLESRFPGGLPEWMGFAFAVERVLGFAIVSFLVAGLAGWAKRFGS